MAVGSSMTHRTKEKPFQFTEVSGQSYIDINIGDSLPLKVVVHF